MKNECYIVNVKISIYYLIEMPIIYNKMYASYARYCAVSSQPGLRDIIMFISRRMNQEMQFLVVAHYDFWYAFPIAKSYNRIATENNAWVDEVFDPVNKFLDSSLSGSLSCAEQYRLLAFYKNMHGALCSQEKRNVDNDFVLSMISRELFSICEDLDLINKVVNFISTHYTHVYTSNLHFMKYLNENKESPQLTVSMNEVNEFLAISFLSKLFSPIWMMYKDLHERSVNDPELALAGIFFSILESSVLTLTANKLKNYVQNIGEINWKISAHHADVAMVNRACESVFGLVLIKRFVNYNFQTQDTNILVFIANGTKQTHQSLIRTYKKIAA